MYRETVTVGNGIQLVKEGRLVYFANSQSPSDPRLDLPFYIARWTKQAEEVFDKMKTMADELSGMPVTYWCLAFERATK